MLKAGVALLLAANLGFLAWSQGWLDGVVGARAIGDREPERLTRQLHPEGVVVLAPGAASDAMAPAAVTCLEAGPFNDAQWASAQAVAQAALPRAAWTTVNVDKPGTWLVYMGRYANRDAMTKKEDELKRRQLAYSEITDIAAFAPGLSLGRFDERASAVQALANFEQQGVRTARVVELTPPSVSHLLRVEKADAVQAAALAALKADALGKGFLACASPPGR